MSRYYHETEYRTVQAWGSSPITGLSGHVPSAELWQGRSLSPAT
jgi:hypothetical protein